MFHLVYKITNIINNKIYIGAHSTEIFNDDYMGSGLNIKKAIAKYGVSFFKKEILSVHPNIDEMYKEEARIVDKNFLSRPDTYNLALGGRGKEPNKKIKFIKRKRVIRVYRTPKSIWIHEN